MERLIVRIMEIIYRIIPISMNIINGFNAKRQYNNN